MKNPSQLLRELKRLPGVANARRWLSDPRGEWCRTRVLSRFERAYASMLQTSPMSNSQGRVLVVSLMESVPVLTLESLLVKSLQLQGVEPCVLTHRGSSAERFYRVLGVNQFVYLDDYLNRETVESATVETLLGQVTSFHHLMTLRYQDVSIGKYLASSLVRRTYTGSVDTEQPTVRARIRSLLFETMAATQAARAIYDEWRPTTTLFLERGYTPFGEFFDLSLHLGLNTLQWSNSHNDQALILKRYTSSNADQHPAGLSQKTWQQLVAAPWSSHQRDAARGELYQNYASGRWFSEVGTQFNTRLMERDQIKRSLKLDPNKKTAVLFSHLFWDATFFWGEDLFSDYQDWFIQAVKVACQNDRINWVLKLHPANIVKLNRDNYHGELVEKRVIREHIGSLPAHVQVLDPNTSINTFSLFDVMDYCLTVRGTIGIEAALFGVTVLTAGTGRYDHYGFTVDSETKEEYLRRLAALQDIPAMTAEQTQLAEKFAYGTFLLRPFPVQSLSVQFRRDRTATMEVNWKPSAPSALAAAPDVQAFGRWAVHSRDEDFIAPLPHSLVSTPATVAP